MGLRINQLWWLFVQGLYSGSRLRRKDMGSSIVRGKYRRPWTCRHSKTCRRLQFWPGWRVHSLGLPPDNQPRRQRRTRLRSEQVIGSQREGSTWVVKRVESKRMELHLVRESWNWLDKNWLRTERNFFGSKVARVGRQRDFHIQVLASLYQWEWLGDNWMYGSRCARRVSSGR